MMTYSTVPASIRSILDDRSMEEDPATTVERLIRCLQNWLINEDVDETIIHEIADRLRLKADLEPVPSNEPTRDWLFRLLFEEFIFQFPDEGPLPQPGETVVILETTKLRLFPSLLANWFAEDSARVSMMGDIEMPSSFGLEHPSIDANPVRTISPEQLDVLRYTFQTTSYADVQIVVLEDPFVGDRFDTNQTLADELGVDQIIATAEADTAGALADRLSPVVDSVAVFPQTPLGQGPPFATLCQLQHPISFCYTGWSGDPELFVYNPRTMAANFLDVPTDKFGPVAPDDSLAVGPDQVENTRQRDSETEQSGESGGSAGKDECHRRTLDVEKGDSDVYWYVARVDPATLLELGMYPAAGANRIARLDGSETTLVQLRIAEREAWGTGTIRLDTQVCQNAGVDSGDSVTVEPATVAPAQRVVLEALDETRTEAPVSVDGADIDGIVFRSGDTMPQLRSEAEKHKRSQWRVVDTAPAGNVVGTEYTTVDTRFPDG